MPAKRTKAEWADLHRDVEMGRRVWDPSPEQLARVAALAAKLEADVRSGKFGSDQ